MHVKFGKMYEFSYHYRTILGYSKPLQLMVKVGLDGLG